MIFTYRNLTFDTATMAPFQTGSECMPTIHVAPDRTCFLELRRKRWIDSRFRLLPRSEALRFADLYEMTALREILTRSTTVGTSETIVEGLTSYMKRIKHGHDRASRRLNPEDQSIVNSMEAICRSENIKVDAARWAHPFASEFSSQRRGDEARAAG